ncbi:hypothetical protein U1Q18_011564 [Sarracenia purpurea var. burkii]
MDAGTETMLSGRSATDVSSLAFSSIPKPRQILNGSPASATGSALLTTTPLAPDYQILPFAQLSPLHLARLSLIFFSWLNYSSLPSCPV